MEARFESAHGAQVQRKKIEEQRPVGFGRQGNHLPFVVLHGVVVDPLEIGGFSTQTWTVVHELAVNFAGRKIDKRHSYPVNSEKVLIAYGPRAGQRSRLLVSPEFKQWSTRFGHFFSFFVRISTLARIDTEAFHFGLLCRPR